MQVFEVLRSIETRLIPGNNSQIKNIISPDKVYLITNDESKKIYILRGGRSTLVYYFIAQKLAKAIRKSKRGFYGIEEIKSEEQTVQMMDMVADDTGIIKEFVNPDFYSKDDPIMDPNNTKVNFLETDPTWRERIQPSNLQVFKKKQNTEHVFDQIKQNPLNPKYKTDLVLIDSSIYTPTKKLTNFLKDRKEERVYEKIGELTEGKFFSPQYMCRFIVKGEHINSIELIRKKDQMEMNTDKINAPVLFIRRIISERSIDILRSSFDLPKVESFDDLLARVREEKASKEPLLSSLDDMKDKKS
ncbi:hypothetical protein DSAG12_03276 [Promethearchaeum syntrophicum]|uniref:Uncharacterized protein n=1 Tax=Promethearchaeum syntrophicum TaxID=2594042 RepID=A0A5B9DDP2_9ARCH|nr:hypothetical protein [Candidatus Prometheoarchaeum syntrophicum]QEE17439.1 hypothetical protein DSAG12_03276 [Candidatus Prometheoarchaeum syntrophicum]